MPTVSTQGTIDSRFAPVRDAFADLLDQQTGTGAAIAAWHDGEWVVDLWGGWADAARSQPWREDSIVMPYSVSKPFAAICALLLVDRGRLDLDAPVQRYWPEFRAPATVRQVLSHQAGVVLLDEPAPTEAFYDWEQLCSLLAQQEPAWVPGTAHGESALFYGHLVGELVRRVDGRSPGRFLREEICGPLRLDFAFGLDARDQSRAVELTGLGDAFRRGNEAGKARSSTGVRSRTRRGRRTRRSSTGGRGARPRSRPSTDTEPHEGWPVSTPHCSRASSSRRTARRGDERAMLGA